MTRAGDSLRQWLEAAPPGTTVRAEEILARLETPAVTPDESAPPTPAERLWSCPPNTRYTVEELAAALHRPKSYIYSLTAAKAIPFSKLDGNLVFVALEIRQWVVDREERINGAIRRVH